MKKPKIWRPRRYGEMNTFCRAWCARCENQADICGLKVTHSFCHEAMRAMHFKEPPGVEWITLDGGQPSCGRFIEA